LQSQSGFLNQTERQNLTNLKADFIANNTF
jgi:hypothetical protein